jgi:immune inhibitor A
VYVEASIDGTNWEILETSSGSLDNPTGSSYGWGYTGNSAGWIKESIDLSRFSGKKVTIRFDYVTDAAIVNNGFLVDDIGILETGYFEDFEASDGGWTALGFARIENSLPQTYQLAMLFQNGTETRVEKLDIAEDQTIDIPIRLGRGEEVVLVVSATTRYTIEAASYQIEIH